MTQRILILIALAAGALAAGSDARLSPAESRDLVAALERARTELLARVAGLNDEQWSYRPGPDRWSAGEVFEHIYRSETGHLQMFERMLAAGKEPEWKKLTAGRNEIFAKIVPDRSQKAQAPPPLQPTGKMSRRALVAAYLAAHDAMIERAQDLETPLKAYVSEQQPLGHVSIANWLFFTPLHTERHVQQIDAALAAPGFPE